MLKRQSVVVLLFLATLLVLALPYNVYPQPANAIGMQPGQVVTPWDDFPLTAPITSQSYSIGVGPKGIPAITWQVITPSAPASLTVNLQASTDGTTYATIDTTTAVGVRTVFGTHKFIRFTVSATAGGVSPTITTRTVYSTGDAVSTTSGAIYGGGTFTGPLLLADGTKAAPSLAFASVPTTGPGFFRYNTATLGFASGGTIYWISGQGIFQFGASTPLSWGPGNPDAGSSDTFIYRDTANTLALRNSTNAQTFNIYNTYTDANNYEKISFFFSANKGYLSTVALGSGAPRNLVLQGASTYVEVSSHLFPSTTDNFDLGYMGGPTMWRTLGLTRSIQGSKFKALTDASATQFVRVSIPQTMGSNYAGGQVIYTVYARDATTGTQTLHGIAEFACINNAGTESCAAIVETYKTAAVVTGGTLTCAITAVTGLTDEIALAANCDTSLTSTALTIEYRLDMPHPNTVTPQ